MSNSLSLYSILLLCVYDKRQPLSRYSRAHFHLQALALVTCISAMLARYHTLQMRLVPTVDLPRGRDFNLTAMCAQGR